MKFETVPQSYIINLLSKTNYSSANDGISGNRRSDDIQRVAAETPEKQSIADTEAVPKLPAQNLSLSQRQRESERMVEYSLINESHMVLTDKKNHVFFLFEGPGIRRQTSENWQGTWGWIQGRFI